MADERDKEITDWLAGPGATVVFVILVILAGGFLYQVIKAAL